MTISIELKMLEDKVLGVRKFTGRYLRGMKKSKSDKTKKAEGKVYGDGKF